MMTGETMKAMGGWGAQDGLLSVAELNALMLTVRQADVPYLNVLEVGHYCGLSTMAIVEACKASGKAWHVTTIDAHCGDRWVPANPYDEFYANHSARFNDPNVSVIMQRSEGIADIRGFNVVFYDGDHAEEQQRFTELVVASPSVKVFIYDDRDFEIPALCSYILRGAGWHEHSRPVVRGAGDKGNPETMTLGVWTCP